MPTVLITGGAGFIGSHTAKALTVRGYHVKVLDSLDAQIHGENAEFPSRFSSNIENIRGDVRCLRTVATALDGVDLVIHLAAQTGVGQSMYDIESYTDTNVRGTAVLLEAIRRSRWQRINRLVLASSRAVYGEGPYECANCREPRNVLQRDRQALARGRFEPRCPSCGMILTPIPAKESESRRPISLYGWTKCHQEDLCLHATGTFGLPVTILRYFNVYGSGQSLRNPYTGILSIFFSRLQHKRPISLYEHGKPLRDFIHVSDVVEANILALEKNCPPGTILNIGTGKAATIAEIAWSLARRMKVTPELRDEGEYRIGDIFACLADISSAKEMLDFRPRVALSDGIAEFVRWASQMHTEDRYDRMVQELHQHSLFGKALSHS